MLLFNLNNQKAVVPLIAVVLLILIGTASAGLIGAAVLPMIKNNLDLSRECTIAKIKINLDSGYSCFYQTKQKVGVTISSPNEKVNLSGIEVYVKGDGRTETIKIIGNLTKANEEVTYLISTNIINIQEVSAAPIVKLGDNEKICAVTARAAPPFLPICSENAVPVGVPIGFSWNCSDGIQNGDETGIDCGGSCISGVEILCSDGIDNDKDCLIDAADGDCPDCSDGIKNQDETDTDCGGIICLKCVDGKSCLIGTDCQSNYCFGGVCITPNCSDGIRNGNETGIDCGAECIIGTEANCSDGIDNDKDCLIDAADGDCFVPPGNCSDGMQNGNETGIDCGGSCINGTELLCSDGIDNDKDCLVDAADGDCTAPTGNTSEMYSLSSSGYPLNQLMIGPYTGSNTTAFASTACSDITSIVKCNAERINDTSASLNTSCAELNTMWQKIYDSDGNFNWDAIFAGMTSNAIGYSQIYLWSSIAQSISMKLGKDDAGRIWVNGSIVWSNPTCEGVTIDDYTVSLSLTQGWNNILLSISEGSGSWGAAYRFTYTNGTAFNSKYTLSKPTSYISADCSDGVMNQNELGIDCGGRCLMGNETLFSDGIDNDKDCLIDCADPDCPSYPPVNMSDGFNTIPFGSSLPGGTATNGSDFWVTDDTDNFAYHIKPTGTGTAINFSDGFKTTFLGSASPAGIATNGSDFWIADYTDDFVYHANSLGQNLSDGFRISSAGLGEPKGMTIKGNDFWVVNDETGTDNFVYHFNSTGSNMSDGFSLYYGIGATTPRGIATNGSDFWVTDEADEFVYHVRPTGTGTATNYSDGFSIKGYGILNSSGITTNILGYNPATWGIPSDFWIADDADDFVYHLKK